MGLPSMERPISRRRNATNGGLKVAVRPDRLTGVDRGDPSAPTSFSLRELALILSLSETNSFTFALLPAREPVVYSVNINCNILLLYNKVDNLRE